MLTQPLPRLWWTKNPRYLLYVVRELTGFFIAAYVLYLLASLFDEVDMYGVWERKSFIAISWIGLIAALIHTMTWFWVTVKISPVPLTKTLRLSAFFLLIAAWLLASFLLLNFFYIPPPYS